MVEFLPHSPLEGLYFDVFKDTIGQLFLPQYPPRHRRAGSIVGTGFRILSIAPMLKAGMRTSG